MRLLLRCSISTLLIILVGCGGSASTTSGANVGEATENPASLGMTQDGGVTPPLDEAQFRATPNQNDDINVPLYIWIITSSEQPDISYEVSDIELQAYVDGANLIWAGADIEFFIEQVERIDLGPELSTQYANFLSSDLSDRSIPRSIIADTGLYNPIFGNMNIVLLKEFGNAAGTAFFVGSAIYLAETNRRGEVRRPTILAHELGHALGLRHVDRSDRECNLMDAGVCNSFDEMYTSNGVLVKSLHPCQVAITRALAPTGFASQTTPESVFCFN